MSGLKDMDPEHREAYAAMKAALAAAAPEHKPAIMRAMLGWVQFVAQNTPRYGGS